MAKGVRVIGILLLVGVLVLVRAYAPVLFYDPLILFFKSAYATQPLLELDFWGLLWSVSLRFWLNSSISLVILWLWFQKGRGAVFPAALWVGLCTIAPGLCSVAANFGSGRDAALVLRASVFDPSYFAVVVGAGVLFLWK